VSGARTAKKWDRPGAGERYARERFRSVRAARRDPELALHLLREHAAGHAGRPLLDAPCGAGRLSAALGSLGAPVVGLDASLSMLEAARAGRSALVCAAIERLPFADASFEAVVCCRLLHHLRGEELERVVGELVRVSARLVVASFWDAGSLPAWRQRLGLKRGEGPAGRDAIARERIAAIFAAAGAPVIAFRPLLRFVSAQTFLVARRREALE
jgi:SAM-dependent methyltransferase